MRSCVSSDKDAKVMAKKVWLPSNPNPNPKPKPKPNSNPNSNPNPNPNPVCKVGYPLMIKASQGGGGKGMVADG